jgi:hypothetical protein
MHIHLPSSGLDGTLPSLERQEGLSFPTRLRVLKRITPIHARSTLKRAPGFFIFFHR